MNSSDDYWRTPEFRKNVVHKIEEEVIKLDLITKKSSQELENEEFQKSQSKEEYLKLIAKLIYFMRQKSKIQERSVAKTELKKYARFRRNSSTKMKKAKKHNLYICAVCDANFPNKLSVKNHLAQNQHCLNILPSSFKSMLPGQWPYTVCSCSTVNNNYILKICLPSIVNIEQSQDWMSEFMKINHCAYAWERSAAKDDSIQEVVYSCQHIEKRSKSPCKSKISFIIKKYETSFSITTIDFDHNHSLNNEDENRLYNPTIEVKEILLKYFENAPNVIEAFRNFQIHVEMQLDTEDEYFGYIADRRKMPVLSWVRQLYNTEYLIKCHPNVAKEDSNLLKKFIADKNEEYGETVCQFQELPNKNYVIFITNPLMKRALKSQAASELVYTDSIGLTAQCGIRVYLLLTNIQGEAVPLALMISTSETNKAIKMGFNLLSSVIDDQTFNGKGRIGPAIIMTDDSIAEIASMKSLFPYSKIVLSVFHFLKACYKWLSKIEHKISKRNREIIYSFIRKMVYAENETLLKELFDNLIGTYKSQETITNYICKLYEKRQTWALYYRRNFVSIESRRNIWKLTMCSVKEQILCKIKNQKVENLILYFFNEFSDFYGKRLIDCALNRLDQMYSIEGSTNNEYNFSKSNSCESLFVCQNKTTGVKYMINSDINSCTCYFGFTGAICEHQKMLYGLTHENLTELIDTEAKLELYYIVTGCRDVPEEFFGLTVIPELFDKSDHLDKNVIETEEFFINTIDNMESDFDNVQPMEEKFVHEIEIEQASGEIDGASKLLYPIIIKNNPEDESIVKIDESQNSKKVESVPSFVYSILIKDEHPSEVVEVMSSSGNIYDSQRLDKFGMNGKLKICDKFEGDVNDVTREFNKFKQNLSNICAIIRKNPSYYKHGLTYLKNELINLKRNPQGLFNALNNFRIRK